MAQQLALGELLTKVHSLRRECNGLSDENAWTQREFYDLQHGKPMQLPKELCVTGGIATNAHVGRSGISFPSILSMYYKCAVCNGTCEPGVLFWYGGLERP